MLAALDKSNLPAFKFNIDIAEKVEEICSPLFDNFNIHNFGLAKIFNDGTMLRVSTGKEWTKKYFDSQYYNDIVFYNFDNIPENGALAKLITNTPNGGVYSALYDYNIWNIFTLYERTPEAAQVWFFATDRNNAAMIDFYFNHRNILQNFMDYFKDRAKSLLIPNPEILIATELNLNNQKLDEERKIKKFLEEIGKTENTRKFLLSRREIECIQHLIMGKSAKEIAHSLNISFRTVQTHINKIKQKTGCKKIGSLLHFIFKKGLLM